MSINKSRVLQIPHEFTPRPHQLEALRSMGAENAPLYNILLWHRRAGKDVVSWVHLITQAAKRVGLYWYVFPLYNMGRKILWHGMDNSGKSLLDLIPKEFISRINNHEMTLHMANGSIVQLVGADSPDTLRGPNPIGVVMSEYSWQDPMVWSTIIAPILKANNGWAIINSTPDGPNHYYDMVKRASNLPGWRVDTKTILDTKVISPEEVQGMIDSGEITEAKAMQEFYCKFNVQTSGSFYGDLITKARSEGRIGTYDYDDLHYVDTFWDLGIGDDCTCWFVQQKGSRRYVIDYFEKQGGQPISKYIDMLRERNYRYRTHYLPHDGKQRHHGINEVLTTQEMFDRILEGAKLGQTYICKKPDRKIHIINNTRSLFNSFYFNESTTKVGLKHLELYKRSYNNKRKAFSNEPLHDASSHAADAFGLISTVAALDDEWEPTTTTRVITNNSVFNRKR